MALVSLCAAGDIATRPSGKDAPKFDPVVGEIIASVGDSVAWTRYDVQPSIFIGHAPPVYTIRYYVQRMGGELILAYQDDIGIATDDRATILEDGTILIRRRGRMPESLVWLHDGRMRAQPISKVVPDVGQVMALFPNGIVADTGGGKDDPAGTTWWIPIRKGEIDFGQRVKMGTRASAEFLKSGDRIAWIDSTHVPAGGEPAGRVPLCVFDIARRQTRSVKIQGPVGEGAHLSAFDGRYGIEGFELFDTSIGKVDDIKGTDNLRGVLRYTPLALIDNRAYFVLERWDRFEVMAVPVDDLAHGKIVYHIARSALAKESLQQHLSAKNLFVASEKTIYAWNGATWENILAK